ncbi:hypothetical protein TRVA0_001S09846 [Trichomonascus vanleenenianus]|uniref:Zn(II)2Cys6 transcription factor n=1 Tax=Trichomonascus vanleenenianus TaxID=2268995 RepID=UPI003ECA7063
MSDDENDQDIDSAPGPACIQCRKRKHKCSREKPCQSCAVAGLPCLYPEFKKRGTKPGYINSLAQRLDQIESIVLGQTMLLAPQLLSNFSGGESSNISDKMDHIRDRLVAKTHETPPSDLREPSITPSTFSGRPCKRRRVSEFGGEALSPAISEYESFLPPPELLTHLCVIYFDQIHPWIPILHEKKFLPSVHTENCPSIILQAITVATVKFSHLPQQEKARYYKTCRQAVLLSSMERFSVDTLQATIILAFETIGSGSGPRSWSLVSYASRVVEQLGLAGEEDDMAQDKLLNRIGFLSPSKTPDEIETRRRIFWSIFLMDRFCAVTTGWNTSLTSSDVKRRLPLEGTLFRDGVPKKARYFNISDPEVDPENEEGLLGGYSYLVEATECLCKTVNFLLHEKTSSLTKQEFRNWLKRFQALDSMLVKWKKYLPEEWQVARVNQWGGMDENLTLAHITHNTSVLLLHQVLAYPFPELRLSTSSSQSIHTCLMAVNEITTITRQLLKHVKKVCAPQMTFCAFVAGRALLIHKFHQGELMEQNFNDLLAALKEMALRWQANGPPQDNLASRFARRLETAKDLNSPIDTRMTVFGDEEKNGPLLSLASPPIADIMGAATAAPTPQVPKGVPDASIGNNQSAFDAVNNNTNQLDFLSEIAAWTDLDYLFTWTDEKQQS